MLFLVHFKVKIFNLIYSSFRDPRAGLIVSLTLMQIIHTLFTVLILMNHESDFVSKQICTCMWGGSDHDLTSETVHLFYYFLLLSAKFLTIEVGRVYTVYTCINLTCWARFSSLSVQVQTELPRAPKSSLHLWTKKNQNVHKPKDIGGV